VFSVVDALTRIAGELKNAGDRAEADQKASMLLSLVNEGRASPGVRARVPGKPAR
jgi:hypothetical protein